MTTTETLIAWHGNPELKDATIAEMRGHREAERLLQNHGYWKGGKGCAVGCLTKTEGGEHRKYEDLFGVPEHLAHLEDVVFEGLPKDDALAWPERFLASIPVGADLSMVWPRFALWMLADESSPMWRASREDDRVAAAVDGVADLYREWVDVGVRPETDRWDAAARAAWDAAASARASARAAARAAARVCAWRTVADKLIELLESAPLPQPTPGRGSR